MISGHPSYMVGSTITLIFLDFSKHVYDTSAIHLIYNWHQSRWRRVNYLLTRLLDEGTSSCWVLAFLRKKGSENLWPVKQLHCVDFFYYSVKILGWRLWNQVRVHQNIMANDCWASAIWGHSSDGFIQYSILSLPSSIDNQRPRERMNDSGDTKQQPAAQSGIISLQKNSSSMAWDQVIDLVWRSTLIAAPTSLYAPGTLLLDLYNASNARLGRTTDSGQWRVMGYRWRSLMNYWWRSNMGYRWRSMMGRRWRSMMDYRWRSM